MTRHPTIQGTYPKPKFWQCFHCGEILKTVGAAEDHFGETPAAVPGCLIGIPPGRSRSLLMALRKSQNRVAELEIELERCQFNDRQVVERNQKV